MLDKYLQGPREQNRPMTPIQFRMDDDTAMYLNALMRAHKLPSLASVVRLAVIRMARDDFGTVPGDRSKPNVPAEYLPKTKRRSKE